MSDVLTNSVWRRSGDIAAVEQDDRVVALDLSSPAAPPVVLEGTAATIWHLLAEEDSEVRLVGLVARAFRVHPIGVRADVHAFLLHLNDLGLVTRSGELP